MDSMEIQYNFGFNASETIQIIEFLQEIYNKYFEKGR